MQQLLTSIVIALSVARSRLTSIAHILFTLLNGLGLACGLLYRLQTPDLYKGNVHGKIGWIGTSVILVQMFMVVLSSRVDQDIEREQRRTYSRLDDGDETRSPLLKSLQRDLRRRTWSQSYMDGGKPITRSATLDSGRHHTLQPLDTGKANTLGLSPQ